jgi:hypothetical protein
MTYNKRLKQSSLFLSHRYKRMVRAIQRISEADKEWRAYKTELARRHNLQEKQRECYEWKEFLKTGQEVGKHGSYKKNTQSAKIWK